MFRGDAMRQGRTPFQVPAASPKVRWQFTTQRPLFGSPAIDGTGNLYVGSLDGRLYSITPDGVLRWQRDLGGRIYASPALTPNGVVVGSDADQMFLLAQADGRTLWTFALGPCAVGGKAPPRNRLAPEGAEKGAGPGPETVRCDADSSPALVKDEIFFGGDALYSVRGDGSLAWRAALPGHAFSSPAVDAAGNLFIGSRGAVLCFDAAGKKRWEQRGLYDYDATPTLSGELVVVGSDDGRLYAFRALDGKPAWVHPTRGPILGSAAVTREGGFVFGSDDGRLRALRPDGTLLWSFPTKGPIRSSPVVDPAGRILFGSQDDRLYLLDSAGKQLWSIELGGDIDSSPAVGADGTIYVGCDDGMLYAVH